MTADNRANEPTEEQVEAAARALRDDKANRTDTYIVPEWQDMPYGDKLVYRGQARAALEAAAVAPQGPRQNETKSGQDFVSLDPERVAKELCESGYRSPDFGLPYCSECYRRAIALCEAAKRGELR